MAAGLEQLLKVLAPAVAAIVLHVAHYNASAQIEYKTRIYTKILGKHAVYYYAVLLVVCALVRDHYINVATEQDPIRDLWIPLGNKSIDVFVGTTLFVAGCLLNLWTLHALGIKGMYNGDSFGWVMDAPVTTGPYKYFSDPQYVGTAMASLGHAIANESPVGVILTIILAVVFYISVKFVEGPHMNRIYSNKEKSRLYPSSKSVRKPPKKTT